MDNSKSDIYTPSGKGIDEITVEAIREGTITNDDLRITPQALEKQARVADESGRGKLAENLRRAAELTAVPDEVLVTIYNALRPGRSTGEELLGWIERLENEYSAARNADLVREVLDVYEKRGLLKQK